MSGFSVVINSNVPDSEVSPIIKAISEVIDLHSEFDQDLAASGVNLPIKKDRVVDALSYPDQAKIIALFELPLLQNYFCALSGDQFIVCSKP